MLVANEELDAWAEDCLRLNGLLLGVMDKLRIQRESERVEELANIRQKLWKLGRQVVRSGAADPLDALPKQVERVGVEVKEAESIPLHLLSSPKAQEFARAMRSAALACAEMERERGIYDGFAEILEDYAVGAEEEVFGKPGRG